MPNKNYIAGRKLEYKAKKELESNDWVVMRTAGSHGPFDLVCVDPEEEFILFIQVKSTKSRAACTRLLNEWVERPPIRVCNKYSQELWVWCDGDWHTELA